MTDGFCGTSSIVLDDFTCCGKAGSRTQQGQRERKLVGTSNKGVGRERERKKKIKIDFVCFPLVTYKGEEETRKGGK